MLKAEGVHLAFWLIGSIGVAGTIALAIAAPTAFSIAFKAVVKFFEVLLSYRIGCAALALVIGLLAADYWRSGKDAADWARQKAMFEAAQKLRDTTIGQETRDKVWEEIANATAENAATDQKVEEFKTYDMPPPPAPGKPPAVNPFAIRDADADKLCIIATGKPCGGPARHKGVPKDRRKAADPHDPRLRLPEVIRRGSGRTE